MRLKGWGRVAGLSLLLTLLPALLVMGGCKVVQSADTVLSSETSPDGLWRARVVERDFVVDGHFASSARTFVLLDRGQGEAAYEQGEEFSPEKIVASPIRSGWLRTQWTRREGDGESQLHVVCGDCGISLVALGRHPDRMGPVEVVYEGFPEESSWERPRSVAKPFEAPSSWGVPAWWAQRLRESMRLREQTGPAEAYAGGRRNVP